MGNSLPVTVTTAITTCPWGTPTAEQWNEFWAMGDVNRDGYIDQTDLDLIVANACGIPGICDPTYDINGDGLVDGRDTAIATLHLGKDICTFFGRRPINLTLTAPETVAPNTPFTLEGYLTAADNGEAIAGAEIVIWKDVGAGWEEITRVNTNALGYYSYQDTVMVEAAFVSGFAGDDVFEGC